MKYLSQNKNFEIRGHWWLPGSNQTAAGDLNCSDGRMELSLYGGLDSFLWESSHAPNNATFPIIHGQSLDGQPISLLRAFYTFRRPGIRRRYGDTGGSFDLMHSRLCCNLAAIGKRLDSDHTFKKCRIDIPSLVTWLADPVFTFDEDDAPLTNFRVEYSRPPTREFSLSSHECKIRVVHTVQRPSIPTTAPRIRHKSYVEIDSEKPRRLEWFIDMTNEVVDLFSLVYGGVLNSKRLILFEEDQSRDGISIHVPRKRIKTKAYRHFDFVVASSHVLSIFGEVLDKWLSASHPTKQSRRMLFASERYPSTFIDVQFLSLAHSLEVISKEHAIIIPKEKFEIVFDALLDAIPADQPKELQDSIRNALKHVNSRNLRTSITGMLEVLGDELCALFCVNRANFINGVVHTRNYFTHYSPSKHVLGGLHLHWTIEKLALLLRIWLLVDAGFARDVVVSCIRGNSKLSGQKRVWEDLNEDGNADVGSDS